MTIIAASIPMIRMLFRDWSGVEDKTQRAVAMYWQHSFTRNGLFGRAKSNTVDPLPRGGTGGDPECGR